MELPVLDNLSRPLRDLRISVTDRCNFRCTYCMPKEIYGRDYAFLPRADILTFEEIERLARIFVTLGVKKLRLTGGEPLVRKDGEILVGMLASISPDVEVAMTTNGSQLAAKAQALADSGLRRITVSLDSLDDAVFGAMNDVGFPVARVLEGIVAAQAAGLSPVKVNMVVRRGFNESSIVPMARYFREHGCVLRFIEYMDVGETNGWQMRDVVPASEIIALVNADIPIHPVDAGYRGEVARRYQYEDGNEVGVITSVTSPFCGDCTRARLSADGALYTCLFSSNGHDLKSLLRQGADDQTLRARIQQIWSGRRDRYSDLRSENMHMPGKVEMSRIGG